MNAKIIATLKSIGAAAAAAAAGVIANHGLPIDHQGWLGIGAAIAVAELTLWAHSPGTAIKAENASSN